MRSKENITDILDYLRSIEKETVKFDEEHIIAAYQKQGNDQTLPIKIVSIFGGILASLAFSGFLVITGIYRSTYGLLGFGTACMVMAIWISKRYDKVILDTVSVSSFIIGLILLWFGLDQLGIHENIRYLTYIMLSLCSLAIVRGYILTFVAIFTLNGSILALILSSRCYDLIHVYVSLLAMLVCYFFLQEANIVNMRKALSALYNPIRTGLVFSFLSGLVCLGKKGLVSASPDYIWITSIVCIAAVLFLTSILLPVLKITKSMHKVFIYTFTILTLLPTALSPAISGTILLMLLSFLVNYRTGFVTSIIALVYFISQYYYDLNFTLLTKSILLFSSGIFFIMVYLLTRKSINK
ncbi:DUF4401 domain-containing protein [Olivibacter domesticus]|uniref:DUF4401 domain-containing protein n=1 Tax=Olivibacter domesticus TaxID=407022 RepID=A0A1H7MVY2_OLID1|nr:DUF4401 domain-containing protein [Olivibacter domesticus]SEL14948.1 protein of unknown function [Olivibacter domesticus]